MCYLTHASWVLKLKLEPSKIFPDFILQEKPGKLHKCFEKKSVKDELVTSSCLYQTSYSRGSETASYWHSILCVTGVHCRLSWLSHPEQMYHLWMLEMKLSFLKIRYHIWIFWWQNAELTDREAFLLIEILLYRRNAECFMPLLLHLWEVKDLLSNTADVLMGLEFVNPILNKERL